MNREISAAWTDPQREVMTLPPHAKVFVEGSAGTGKTTAAIEWLNACLDAGIPSHEITVLVPQPLLGRPYRLFDEVREGVRGTDLRITTYAGLARQALTLFWPQIVKKAGFKTVRSEPLYLDAEAAQFQMGRLIDPLIEQKRLFETVRLPRRRMYMQILDSLNKSAVVPFPVEEIGLRLQEAWTGDDYQRRMYEDVQTCCTAFREMCLEQGLVDFSLMVELFNTHVRPTPACHRWLSGMTRHLIVDNPEEGIPVAHDLIMELIADSDGALVLFDTDAGYRLLLGADEVSAYRLKDACAESVAFDEPVIGTGQHDELIAEFGVSFGRSRGGEPDGDPLNSAEINGYRYFPDMVEAVCVEAARLVQEEGVEPEQIAIVTPYLSDALRFALVNRLERLDVPVRSLRPSRPLGSESPARCMLLLAQLAHPGWDVKMTSADVAQALTLAITELDPVRAYLLASTYRPKTGLMPFSDIAPALQERITFRLGERYEQLRGWLAEYRSGDVQPLDHFLARLYSELLSQESFRYYGVLDYSTIAGLVVRSARDFRRMAEALGTEETTAEYVQAVLDGLIGAQTLSRRDDPLEGGVKVAPAYTYLMANTPVQYQFWLDIGSTGWSERLHQPLGQPYVLSRNWPVGKPWTADDEAATNAEDAYRVVAGLLRRCTERVWLTHCDYNEQGFTQQGALLTALQRMLRRRGAAGQEAQA